MDERLGAVLARARELGFLGPGDPESHRRHAIAFARAYEALRGGPAGSLCDLGSGGGVPGLVLALRWPGSRVVLLEASHRRCEALRAAAADLGLEEVEVLEGRAETLARDPSLEGRFPLVCARSFGPPAVTAECAARLVEAGGLLLVAEPPAGEAPPRWPEEGLALLGLGPATPAWEAPSLVAIERVGLCPDRFPRRDGIPAKRPLF